MQKIYSGSQVKNGRKTEGFVDYDDFEFDDYYNEDPARKDLQFVKKASQGYDLEEEHRGLLEKTFSQESIVEQPNDNLLTKLYEQTLSKITQLIQQICSDEMCLVYKQELMRLYNLLMVYVVNDPYKSKVVCELLGQSFHKLVNCAYEDFFIQAGIPDEWSSSTTGARLANSDFEE